MAVDVEPPKESQDDQNGLVAQAMSLGDLVRDQVPILCDAVRTAVPTRVQLGMRQLILTGCGDSAIAGRATEHLFRSLTGVPTVAESAMKVSRFTAPLYSGEYPFTPVVVALSNSGEVARVVEAARNVRSVGGYAIAVTGSASTPLAAEADVVIAASAPPLVPAPGTRSYVESLLALIVLAIRIGEVRGRLTMDQAEALRAELVGLADLLDQVAEESLTVIETLGSDWSDFERFDTVAAGIDLASAEYGAAKLIEAVGVHAAAVDLEEFFHLNYFVRDPERTGTVVVAPAGSAAESRVAELLPVLQHLGRPTVVLGFPHGGFPTIPLPEVRPDFTPLLAVAPLAILAGWLMDARNETPGRGHEGRWALSREGATIRESSIRGRMQGGKGMVFDSEDGRG